MTLIAGLLTTKVGIMVALSLPWAGWSGGDRGAAIKRWCLWFDLFKGCHYWLVFRGRFLSSGLIGAWITHFVFGIHGRLHTLTGADLNKYRVWDFFIVVIRYNLLLFLMVVIRYNPFVVLKFPVDQHCCFCCFSYHLPLLWNRF